MVRYTSILLSLARGKKRRLEEAARARGESLEGFILAAAEAEAERLGARLIAGGHRIDHPIWVESAIDEAVGGAASGPGGDEWDQTIDAMIEALDALDRFEPETIEASNDGEGSRRSPRTSVADVRLLNPVYGKVVDLSARGLGVQTYRPFTVPERTTLSIGRTTASAKIRAEVRWCLLTRTERADNGDVVPVYRSGLAFVGSS